MTLTKPPDKIFSKEDFSQFEKELVQTMEDRLKNNQPVNKAFGGPFGTDPAEARMNYIRARNEKVIRKKIPLNLKSILWMKLLKVKLICLVVQKELY